MAAAAEFYIPIENLPDEGTLGEFIILKNDIPDFAQKAAALVLKNYRSIPFTKSAREVITKTIMNYLINTYPATYGYIAQDVPLTEKFGKFISNNISSIYSLYGPNSKQAQELAAQAVAENAKREAEYSEKEGFMSENEKKSYLHQKKMEKQARLTQLQLEKAAVKMIISTINDTIPRIPSNDYGEHLLLASSNPIEQQLGKNIEERRKAHKPQLALKVELESKKQELIKQQQELEQQEKEMTALLEKMGIHGGKRSTNKRKTRKHSKKSRSHRKSSKKTMRKRSNKRRNKRRSTRRRN
jgi:hypothetical protein